MSLTSRGRWREPPEYEAAVEEARDLGHPVEDEQATLDRLVEAVGDADYVLLGEASHGTSEYYRWRARLTARLVQERDAAFVAVEGDWPPCAEVTRYVRGHEDAPDTARAALAAFERWPTWMWANWEVEEFVEWLALHNETVDETVGFYGLDVYSLHESMDAVVDYLENVDPEAADQAREAYRCFEPYGEDAQEYARSLRMVPEGCEDEVVEVLSDLRERAAADSIDEFGAEQNALVARNAESYYRAMVSGEEDSWNVRDRHMADTLDRLVEEHGGPAIVWAHNTHVGDARATDMERKGRLNIGQLVRERHEDVAVVGFGSHHGEVVAGEEWGATMEVMDVPAAREGSYEDVLHRAGGDRLLLLDDLPANAALGEPRGHRAIGVVYRPSLESGNYVPTDLPERYDAFLHLDETSALHPFATHTDREVVPDLYPSGL